MRICVYFPPRCPDVLKSRDPRCAPREAQRDPCIRVRAEVLLGFVLRLAPRPAVKAHPRTLARAHHRQPTPTLDATTGSACRRTLCGRSRSGTPPRHGLGSRRRPRAGARCPASRLRRSRRCRSPAGRVLVWPNTRRVTGPGARAEEVVLHLRADAGMRAVFRRTWPTSSATGAAGLKNRRRAGPPRARCAPGPGPGARASRWRGFRRSVALVGRRSVWLGAFCASAGKETETEERETGECDSDGFHAPDPTRAAGCATPTFQVQAHAPHARRSQVPQHARPTRAPLW